MVFLGPVSGQIRSLNFSKKNENKVKRHYIYH